MDNIPEDRVGAELLELIEELGIDKLTPEEQKPIFESMMRNLSYRVTHRLAEVMSEQELAELQEFLESNSKEAAMAEFEQRFPNLPQIYEEELRSIKESVKEML